MPPTRRPTVTVVPMCFAAVGAAVLILAPAPAAAQSAPAIPGVYLEIEGQAAFGASNTDVGFVPLDPFAETGASAKLDDGDGRAGALAIGYTWSGGWSAAVRARHGEIDDRDGPIQPGVVAYVPGDDLIPGGFPVPLAEAQTQVRLKTTTVDLELGKDISFSGIPLYVYGALAYAALDRKISIADDGCGCLPLNLAMANTFHGVGPKIGARATVPIATGVDLAGGASLAALFGRTKFKSELNNLPLDVTPRYAEGDDRVVAAANAEAGLVFTYGAASMTLGYRVDAIFDALDSDQRVAAEFLDYGFPAIGERHDDVVTHGPFARITLRP